MDWIEVTARSVEEAKELALDSLGVHETELEFEVLEEPRSGFLGIGRVPARIRARVRPLSREKPQDRRRRRRSSPRRTDAPHADAVGAAAPAARGPAATDRGETAPRRRRRGGRSPGTGGSGSPAASAPAEPRTPLDSPPRPHDGGPDMAEATISVDEQLTEAKDFAEGLVEAFGVDATVRATLDDDDITVDIEGENLGVLVGPKGATLAAVEELVRTAVLVRAGGFGARIHVDVGGYRRRRRDALSEFASRLAADVRASGVAKALEPMSPADRKVVHDTIAEIEGVVTSSEGEDQRRHVVIRPG